MDNADMELLNRAAKSIGYDLHVNLADAAQIWKDGEYVAFWNPLNSDGDALRLAVALNAHISIDFDLPRNAVVVGMNGGVDGDGACSKETGEDPCAVTRRAIVRAAAQLI